MKDQNFKEEFSKVENDLLLFIESFEDDELLKRVGESLRQLELLAHSEAFNKSVKGYRDGQRDLAYKFKQIADDYIYRPLLS